MTLSVPFVILWTIILLGLSLTTRRQNGPSHEVMLAPWIFRLALIAALLVEPHLSEHQVLNGLPFIPLLPIQTPVDFIGFLILHRKGRHRLENIFTLNIPVIASYVAIPPLIVYEYLAKREERLRYRKLEEFSESLPPWVKHTLLRLEHRSYAKRRAELKLTRKRSRTLSEMGLAEEDEYKSLHQTTLGKTVTQVLLAGREDGHRSADAGRPRASRRTSFRGL